jgi:adenylate kinase
MNKGVLVPDFITNAYTANEVLMNYTGREHVIFDGYPRSIPQSQAFKDLAEFYDWKTLDIVIINISEDEAVKRLMSRRRHDDTPEGIQQRVQVYKEQVIPALDHLKENLSCRVHEINGEQSIEGVHDDIRKALSLV